jgi:hypothetical protein
MRVISWNANCKFRDKYHLRSNFDIAFVQECEQNLHFAANIIGYAAPYNTYDLYSVKADWPTAVEAVAKRGTLGDVEI